MGPEDQIGSYRLPRLAAVTASLGLAVGVALPWPAAFAGESRPVLTPEARQEVARLVFAPPEPPASLAGGFGADGRHRVRDIRLWK